MATTERGSQAAGGLKMGSSVPSSANWGNHNNKLSAQHECLQANKLLADCAKMNSVHQTLFLWMRVWPRETITSWHPCRHACTAGLILVTLINQMHAADDSRASGNYGQSSVKPNNIHLQVGHMHCVNVRIIVQIELLF